MSKVIKYVLFTLAFAFQFILPVVLFGGVIPYTHSEEGAGLTKMGYIALFVILIIAFFKLKKFLKKKLSSLTGSILDSVFPITVWIAVRICLDHIVSLVNNLSHYWGRILIFIIIGRLCHWIACYMDRTDGVEETTDE